VDGGDVDDSVCDFVFYTNSGFVLMSSKCKAIQLQAWTDPEGSRSLKLPDFKTISI